ncbi:acetyl-CoA carboxylase biotin carboxylase subunit [Neoroseomonas soli]|uniref:ATP-grasp domain-containing protein n=1 Tax=Neoroseomonas soli TaxID=1081025 RepID=A0A9X9WTJ7_9PROT|nr:ATP-grasp domain-containing protein [Neoroseomonas soli]
MTVPPFRTILIANRGAVASRVVRAVHRLGIRAVAVHSDADAGAPYLTEADEAIRIGPPPVRESYLNQDAILEAARRCGADAIHPGYGFLSENEEFARRVEAAGMTFIGPSPRHIGAMGQKTRAREIMAANGFPVAPGSGLLPPDPDRILAAAREIGFPVMVKPTAGGGGIGMAVAKDEATLQRTIERARSAAERSFADGGVYLERYFELARHVEIQLLGDRHGRVRHLFERDCSLQRRHQKIIEEAPAPLLPRAAVAEIAELAANALQRLGYDNIGTVEMLLSADGSFGFLEVNTRLQVEHAVTEMVTGVDLVASQIRSAAGEPIDAILPANLHPKGHAIEARIYAEDPKRFLPSPGRLDRFDLPAGSSWRIETGFREGMEVTPFYDPMIAKVVAHESTRGDAIRSLRELLSATRIEGVKTNVPFLMAALDDERFVTGKVHTGLSSDIHIG